MGIGPASPLNRGDFLAQKQESVLHRFFEIGKSLFTHKARVVGYLSSSCYSHIAKVSCFLVRGDLLQLIRLTTYSTILSSDCWTSNFADRLYQHELSVLVGHHHDIDIMAQFLGKPFRVPGFPAYWVPENSGFVFTLGKNSIKIEIIYYTRDLKIKVIPYMKIPIPQASGLFDLIPRRINYVC